MAGQTVCPRCGARDSFMKGYLPDTCVCRICLSQLDWREIPGCGPDCKAAPAEAPSAEAPSASEGTEQGER
jgi:ribosomal protein S14